MSPTVFCTSLAMSRLSSLVASWSSMAGRRPNKETEALCSTNQTIKTLPMHQRTRTAAAVDKEEIAI